MKFLATFVLLIFFSLEGAGQRFLLNTNYSFHRFYDSGTYNFKLPEGARANLINIGVTCNWRQFDLGIGTSLGTLKNLKYEGSMVGKTNIIGANAIINYHFLKTDRNFYIDPFMFCGYGFKRVSIASQLVTYYQSSYGLGFNFKVTGKLAVSISESFNLSFKNMYFNNLQTSIGMVWLISGPPAQISPADYENLNRRIKEDSISQVKRVKELEFKWTFKERKLRDSLEKQIDFQKKTIEKLTKDKNTLLESSVTLKGQIDEIRKNNWASYEVFKLTKDTLLKLDKLPIGDYACYTAPHLPGADERKHIINIKGSIFICINAYNYYKICIEANSREPIIPPDFLKYYPLAELWKKEGD